MGIHKEGYKILLIALVAFIAIIAFLYIVFPQYEPYNKTIAIFIVMFYIFLVHFFFRPERSVSPNEKIIYAPADGEVVVVEETEETEFLKERCIQVSIFMSIWDVHINWIPVPGKIKKTIYHKGKFLIAYLPKSSTDNERTSILIETPQGIPVVVRQIAGFIARRIRTYVKEGDMVNQNQELGFIKFGSRVDLFLPVNTPISVKVGEKVKGNETAIGHLA